MLEEDFRWLLGRLSKGPETAFGQALRRVWVEGELPAMACWAIGVQISKFIPTYEASRRIVAGMSVSEADGFTQEEVELGNRVLALCRRKESPFEPNVAQWAGMGRLDKAGELSIPVTHDVCHALLGLVEPGFVLARMAPPTDCVFSLTDAGRTALEKSFQ